MPINPNIDVPHRIEANAHDTMAAERLRTWEGNPDPYRPVGIAPVEINNPGSRIVCNRKGEGKRLYIAFDDGSKLVIEMNINTTTRITAKRR